MFKSFRCVLPGHDHTARANFTRITGAEFSNTGFWQYYCDGLRQSVGLGEVRAFIAYGEERRLTPWRRRDGMSGWTSRLDFGTQSP